jgi:Fur family ferric uptake transcriptional regulator
MFASVASPRIEVVSSSSRLGDPGHHHVQEGHDGPEKQDPSLANVLRARGLRLTPQRQLVLEAVYTLGHATPDQVHAAVSRTAAGVNITTVYRTLELLEDLGLVTHTHLSHGSPTYHAVGEEQHVHLVCRGCGGVDEVSPSVLDGLVEGLRRDRGFSVDVGHVALFGICRQCATSNSSERTSHPDDPASESENL